MLGEMSVIELQILHDSTYLNYLNRKQNKVMIGKG